MNDINWEELKNSWPLCYLWSATVDNLLIGRAEYQHVLAAEMSDDRTFWVNTNTLDVIPEHYAKQAYVDGADVALVRLELQREKCNA